MNDLVANDMRCNDIRCQILGIPISVINMPAAIERIDQLTQLQRGSYVCVTDVNNVMLAQSNEAHRRILSQADMVTPDGTPLSFVARLRGTRGIARVCGPDLMLEAMQQSARRGWKHFLLGGAEGVPDRLRSRLAFEFPDAEIVDTYSPPFRSLSPQEDEALVSRIRGSGAKILWIGLGCPKQEKWMADHAARLPGIVQIGVGAAFNFHTGEIRRAPRWMRHSGLEWLHRFASEPRRLWRRYLVLAPCFVFAALRETVARSYPPNHNRGATECTRRSVLDRP